VRAKNSPEKRRFGGENKISSGLSEVWLYQTEQSSGNSF
jgi:hypothetical protein